MKVICVGSSSSGMGKTTLCEQILRSHRGFCALKVTTVRPGEGKEDDGIIRGNTKGYVLVSDENILNEPGKDTRRMKDAGAVKVLWLNALPERMKEGLDAAFPMLKECAGVIIEGNTAANQIDSCIRIFIHDDKSEMKESSRRLLENADIILAKSECAGGDLSGEIIPWPPGNEEAPAQFLPSLDRLLEENPQKNGKKNGDS